MRLRGPADGDRRDRDDCRRCAQKVSNVPHAFFTRVDAKPASAKSQRIGGQQQVFYYTVFRCVWKGEVLLIESA